MNVIKKLFGIEAPFSAQVILDRNEGNERYRLPYFADKPPIFVDANNITGKVEISLKPGQQISHSDITISIIGQFRTKETNSLEIFYQKTNILIPQGTITNNLSMQFLIDPIISNIPSYYGTNYDAIYSVQLKINSYTFDEPFYYLMLTPPPNDLPDGYSKTEIGIQGILQIDTFFKNFFFDVTDTVYGLMYFHLVKIRIVNVYFQVQRWETYKTKFSKVSKRCTVASVEVLDGTPVRGDLIPIRCFMPGIEAWPYPRNANANLTVKYRIRLLFIDENGKHYYKELGISVFRCPIEDGPKEAESPKLDDF